MMRSWMAAALLIGLLGCGRYGPPERRPVPSAQPTPAVSAVSAGDTAGAAEECEDPETKAEAAAEVPR